MDSFEKTPVKPVQNEVKSSTNSERFISFFCIMVWLYCAQKWLINHILTHYLKLKIIYFKQKRFFIKNVEIKTDKNVKVIFYKYFIVKMS